jgi:hypothetical protein
MFSFQSGLEAKQVGVMSATGRALYPPRNSNGDRHFNLKSRTWIKTNKIQYFRTLISATLMAAASRLSCVNEVHGMNASLYRIVSVFHLSARFFSDTP